MAKKNTFIWQNPQIRPWSGNQSGGHFDLNLFFVAAQDRAGAARLLPVLRRLSISKYRLILRISDHRFAPTTVSHLRPRPSSSDPEFVHEFVCHISVARGNEARGNGKHAVTGRAGNGARLKTGRARQRGARGNGARGNGARSIQSKLQAMGCAW